MIGVVVGVEFDFRCKNNTFYLIMEIWCGGSADLPGIRNLEGLATI